jgi:hypothetical protein
MIAYLDEQIKEAKQTLNETRTSKDRLDGLQRTRKEYEQHIRILEKEMRAGQTRKPLDERDIELLVKKLYKLKHWGQNLKDIKTAAENYGSSPYQERLFRAPRYWHTSHGSHAAPVSRGFQGSIPHRSVGDKGGEGSYKQSYSHNHSYSQSSGSYGQSNGSYSHSNGESYDQPPAYSSLIPPETEAEPHGVMASRQRPVMRRITASEQNVQEVEPSSVSRKLKSKIFGKFK